MKTRSLSLYLKKFSNLINDDLDTPKAIALLWDIVKSPYLKNQEKHDLILSFDRVFGLNLTKIKRLKIPQEIKGLADERKKYRINKKWKEADEIRKELEELGYQIEDTKEGPKIKKTS